MSTIVKAYAPSAHGQLHYRICRPKGELTKPALLCLHQTPNSGADWEPIMADLAIGRVVVAPDTPGYGMSDPPAAPLSIPDFARIMVDFMGELARENVVESGVFDLMGFHTGSITSTEIATSFPDRVRRLVLFGLAAYDEDIRGAKLAALATAFPPPGEDLTHIEKLWAIISKLSDPRMGAEERHKSMAESLRLGARMPWGFAAVYRYDFLEAMAKLEHRVLIMNPEDDLWTPTHATSHLFKNGRRVDFPGV